MRPKIRIELEDDPSRKGKKLVVLKEPCGNAHLLAYDLKPQEAARLLVPLRKAFMAGVAWLREDISAYAMTVTPDVNCATEAT